MMKNLKKKKGFTLIELIIVIAILGILAAIAIPRFGNVQKDSKIKADIASAKVIADAATIALADGTVTETAYNTAKAIDTDLAGKLQTIPKVQLDSGNQFFVKISSNGVVTVYATTAATSATVATQVYPKPENSGGTSTASNPYYGTIPASS